MEYQRARSQRGPAQGSCLSSSVEIYAVEITNEESFAYRKSKKRWVTLKLRHHTKIMLDESAKMVGHEIKMISKDKRYFNIKHLKTLFPFVCH